MFNEVIGLSATSVGMTNATEDAYLKKLKFKILQSGIDSTITTMKIPQKSLDDFLDFNKSQRARLIYCKKEDQAAYLKKATAAKYDAKVNHSNIEDLRNLLPYDCLIVSDPTLMRGVDYHCETKGIDLLIATQFPNTRAYVQGLGRVGRYYFPCGRFCHPDIENPVNEREEHALMATLHQLTNAIPAKLRTTTSDQAPA